MYKNLIGNMRKTGDKQTNVVASPLVPKSPAVPACVEINMLDRYNNTNQDSSQSTWERI
jgi:hypothetical protein